LSGERDGFCPRQPYRGDAFSTLTAKRFTGQYHEASIPGGGVYYYGAKWYHARLGRFTSADSIVPGAGNPQAFNCYTVNSTRKV
jgi:RHS repeat-associated protein